MREKKEKDIQIDRRERERQTDRQTEDGGETETDRGEWREIETGEREERDRETVRQTETERSFS